VDYVSDATRRADGTVNRRVLSLLDPRVPAFSSSCRGVASRDVVIDPAIRLRARLFHPAARPAGSAAPLPVIVFFHGGGFAFLSNASLAYDAVCRRIARYASAAVLSVDYRRAPEYRFPAPYDDGVAALRFLDDPKNHPADVPLDASRCFLAGDSAGGNISPCCIQKAMRCGSTRCASQKRFARPTISTCRENLRASRRRNWRWRSG
jgi:acetyl esterase/lipase